MLRQVLGKVDRAVSEGKRRKFVSFRSQQAIFKTGNGESENGNGEREWGTGMGNGNGERETENGERGTGNL